VRAVVFGASIEFSTGYTGSRPPAVAVRGSGLAPYWHHAPPTAL